jgi:glutamate-1-semialdehyde 2,1-aminomutase
VLTQEGALLVFDEVIDWFPIAYCGVQGTFGVTPDLTTLGKVIAALASMAYGGRKDITPEVDRLGLCTRQERSLGIFIDDSGN